MSNEIPVEVYETLVPMHQRSLLKAIADGDEKLMAKSIQRLTRSLEAINQYKEGEGK